jgi:hypothetical protein
MSSAYTQRESLVRGTFGDVDGTLAFLPINSKIFHQSHGNKSPLNL